MATYNQILGGLTLLVTCEKAGGGAHGVDAEHDIIYAGPDISEVSVEMGKRLEAMGWHKSDADRWAIYT